MLDIIAREIHEKIYSTVYDYKTTIFLCGAGTDVSNSIRRKIDELLTSSWYSFWYELFYPEDLFQELLYGHEHQDLITLENILAESVDVIILVIESYGSVAELGAFASNDKLRKKLLCVVDKRYKKTKSFINYGPLRLLKDKREGCVVYSDFKKISEKNEFEKMRKGINSIKRNTRKKSPAVTNVIQAHHFILASVYLLEPINKKDLISLVKFASDIYEQKAVAVTAGALSILSNKKEVYLQPSGFCLTKKGMSHFRALGRRGWTRNVYKVSELDHIRVIILNWQLRGKKYNI